MAAKEKIDIKRSDLFQEVDDELTRAMEELDSTIERVSLIFQADTSEELPGISGAPAAEEPEDGRTDPPPAADSENGES